MRSVPTDIAGKLVQKKQTTANNAAPSASLWIGRPTTALTTDAFLERQTVLTGPITDTSIAVCHPRLGAPNTKIHIAYISEGKAKVVAAATKAKMANHIWVDTEFLENADSVSIVYNGIMPKNRNGTVEFVTESQPWMFWTNAGTLYARKLDGTVTDVLAEQNCTDVSAVRAMWSEAGGFDFGLVAFFVLGGVIYYRQYVNGEWLDAEVVSFGPSGKNWVSIAAFRTWDYRIGVQAKASTGEIYELFSQFMGVGKQNVEHLEIAGVESVADRIKTLQTMARPEENISVNTVEATGDKQWGLPVYGSIAWNAPNESGNWGIYVSVTLDHPCNVDTVPGNQGYFKLVDDTGVTYVAESISASSDGKTITLQFADFNSAKGMCKVDYTPGGIQSPAKLGGIPMLSWNVWFTPQNLDAPQVEAPVPVEVWNE